MIVRKCDLDEVMRTVFLQGRFKADGHCTKFSKNVYFRNLQFDDK